MTMTDETDELIERLKAKQGDGPGTRRHYELTEIIAALRQLQAERDALRQESAALRDNGLREAYEEGFSDCFVAEPSGDLRDFEGSQVAQKYRAALERQNGAKDGANSDYPSRK